MSGQLHCRVLGTQLETMPKTAASLRTQWKFKQFCFCDVYGSYQKLPEAATGRCSVRKYVLFLPRSYVIGTCHLYLNGTGKFSRRLNFFCHDILPRERKSFFFEDFRRFDLEFLTQVRESISKQVRFLDPQFFSRTSQFPQVANHK